MAGKQPQKTPPAKHAPPRVADGPPDTPQGRRRYDGESLADSAGYADRRPSEAVKPYAAEAEAAPLRAAEAREPKPPVTEAAAVPWHPRATGRSPRAERSRH